MKSLLDDDSIWSVIASSRSKEPTTPEYRLERSITLNPTVGSCLNFYRSFRRLSSLASQWNCLSTTTASGRAKPPTRPEYQLKGYKTLNPTVWSCSNLYRSLRRLFSLALRRIRYAMRDSVWSGQTTDHTRVPAQKVPNSWSDRWIVLKCLLEFAEAVFFGVAKKLLIDADDVLSGQTTDQARVPAQLARNSWSNRWIVLKFSQEFAEAVFLGIAMTLLIDAYNVWSGLTINQTRVLAPQFHNS
jgi:hypothetical protein